MYNTKQALEKKGQHLPCPYEVLFTNKNMDFPAEVKKAVV